MEGIKGAARSLHVEGRQHRERSVSDDTKVSSVKSTRNQIANLHKLVSINIAEVFNPITQNAQILKRSPNGCYGETLAIPFRNNPEIMSLIREVVSVSKKYSSQFNPQNNPHITIAGLCSSANKAEFQKQFAMFSGNMSKIESDTQEFLADKRVTLTEINVLENGTIRMLFSIAGDNKALGSLGDYRDRIKKNGAKDSYRSDLVHMVIGNYAGESLSPRERKEVECLFNKFVEKRLEHGTKSRIRSYNLAGAIVERYRFTSASLSADAVEIEKTVAGFKIPEGYSELRKKQLRLLAQSSNFEAH